MRKFAGNKPTEAILALCKAEGVEVDLKDYLNGGDWIFLKGGGAFVEYNTVSGRFSGTTPEGVLFNSNDTTHENEWWFQKLLEFFYEPLPDVPISPFVNKPVADLVTEDGQAVDMKFGHSESEAAQEGGNRQADMYAEAAAQIYSAPEVVKPAADLAPATYPDPFKPVSEEQ